MPESDHAALFRISGSSAAATSALIERVPDGVGVFEGVCEKVCEGVCVGEGR